MAINRSPAFALTAPSSGPDVRYVPICPAATGTPLQRQIVAAALLGALSVLLSAELEALLGHELVPQEADALDDGAGYWHAPASLQFINEVLIPRLDRYAPQGFSFCANQKNLLGFWPTGDKHESNTN